ncbi:Mucin-associated surface protein (MASP), subgroup S074 [Trypanosoma cruzi]|nr:Mucin-associated surface protein (MASP), subgroup S074 [Trypanosoma cruzi]
MAMMMTGRALLVCALCVLWCLTVFGDARDNRRSEDDGNVLTHTHNGGNDGLRLKADFGLISTRMGLIKAVEAEEREEDLESDNAPLDSVGGKSPGGEPAGIGGNEAPGAGGGQGAAGAGAPSLPSGPGVPWTGDKNSQSLIAGQEGNEKNSLEPKKKEPKEPQEQTTDQLPSSSGSTSTRSGEKLSSKGTSEITQLPKETVTKGVVNPRNKSDDDEERDEEETGREKQKNKAQTGSRESQNNGGETPPPPLPSSEGEGSPLPDPENSQNPKKVTNEATHSGPKMESKAPEPPSGDATQGQHSHDTDTEVSTKNAATGSPAETAAASSTSTSGSGDHVHNKADKDDAQSSEGQHDSLETGNTKVVSTLSETAPQTATANTTYTTTKIADSDGSTAVSHTTSPLLLLLLVACAAAAAVAIV